MSYSDAQIWLVIAALGIGTFLIRFSFLGVIGSRPLPVWLLRLLRYTPVAILPGIAAPLIFTANEAGNIDPARLAAAVITVAVGWWTRNITAAIAGGLGAFYGLSAFLTI